MADKNNKKEIIEISVPDSMFFRGWEGDRQIRRIYCQTEIPEGGKGYCLLFGLPKPAKVEDLITIYPGVDVAEAIRKAVLQYSYGKDSATKENVVKEDIDWATADPETDLRVKALIAGFETDLKTLAERKTGETAKVKAKASELDQSIREFGLDPENPEDRETYRSIVKKIAAQQKAKKAKAAK